MSNEVISYFDMCSREKTSLQRGMNFRLHGGHSVVLLSTRGNAPYRDEVKEDGTVLIYEGHDVPTSEDVPIPKIVDQRECLPSGRLTENGKFRKAVLDYKSGLQGPDLVRAYEKIKKGIWSYNGLFELVDVWKEKSGEREVFKFKLVAIKEKVDSGLSFEGQDVKHERRRIIPSHVKLAVWKRDGGRCVQCGSEDELHFDHILPFSKGGTSLKEENVQLLCARHNLQKSDKIE